MARDARWDWLEGLRPTSLEETLAHEAARVLADELFDWPPHVEWEDARAEAEFAPLFTMTATRPTPAAFTMGFRFARWELERAFDAIDHAVRNDLVAREVSSELERLQVRFVWRWIPEWLLELKERAGPRITRAHLLQALGQAEARLRGRLMSAGVH